LIFRGRGKVIFDESNSWPWNPDGFRITRIFDADGVNLLRYALSINTTTGEVVMQKRGADGRVILNAGKTAVETETVLHPVPFSIDFDPAYAQPPEFEHDSKRPPSNELLADGGEFAPCGIEAFLAVVAFPVVFALLWRLFFGLFVEG